MVAAPSGVLLKMEVVYANGRGEGFEGTLLIYDHWGEYTLSKKTRRLVYGVYPRISPNTPLAAPMPKTARSVQPFWENSHLWPRVTFVFDWQTNTGPQLIPHRHSAAQVNSLLTFGEVMCTSVRLVLHWHCQLWSLSVASDIWWINVRWNSLQAVLITERLALTPRLRSAVDLLYNLFIYLFKHQRQRAQAN